jgi:hypothetical protein
MRRLPALVALVLLPLSACGDAPSAAADPSWRTALARWEGLALQDYSYELRTEVWHVFQGTPWHRIEVRGGRVVSAVPLEPLPAGFRARPLDEWPTIPMLFATARATPTSDVAAIDVTYHPTYGHPVRIAVRCRETVAQCGSTTEVRNLGAWAPALAVLPGTHRW